MSVKLISVTPDAEKMMAYVARVSNPNNQENPNYAKLLGYCIKHNHWSVFEQAFMTLELETTRGVALKCFVIVRSHIKNFRNATLIVQCLRKQIPMFELRRQDTKNRQNSIDDIDPFVKQEFEIKISRTSMKQWCSINQCLIWESQRSVHVLCFPSPRPQEFTCPVLVRSWIHYINLRTANGTQKEHMDLAEGCKKVFIEQFPTCAGSS